MWIGCVIVGALWGATNPILKRNTNDLTHIKRDGAITQFFAEMRYTFTNIGFIVPFALNQLGSLLFVKLLGEAPLSIAVPACNALTFVFTAGVSWLLGERSRRPLRAAAGSCLVLAGLTICVHSKSKAGVAS